MCFVFFFFHTDEKDTLTECYSHVCAKWNLDILLREIREASNAKNGYSLQGE